MPFRSLLSILGVGLWPAVPPTSSERRIATLYEGSDVRSIAPALLLTPHLVQATLARVQHRLQAHSCETLKAVLATR